MINGIKNWFRRNEYGKFAFRLIIAIGSAIVAVLLSLFPHDTVLQAVWVVASTMFMGFVVLRQRLNETDDVRFQRLFKARFAYLQANDPEALNTIFAENLRPRVMDWFAQESGVEIKSVNKIDAVDSLAKNGDVPGQLLMRTGVEFGKWFQEVWDREDKIPHFNYRVQKFIDDHEHLLGEKLEDGFYFRRIRIGENVPTGIHMFHDTSRLLMSLKEYEEGRASLSLSARTHVFEVHGNDWDKFKTQVHRLFPEFQPVNGGSGPQRVEIPFFVGSVSAYPVSVDEELKTKLKKLGATLTIPAEKDSEETPTEN
ncbi:MAG: hypothetical protein AAF623_13865 [Planctomycetota bacterium]